MSSSLRTMICTLGLLVCAGLPAYAQVQPEKTPVPTPPPIQQRFERQEQLARPAVERRRGQNDRITLSNGVLTLESSTQVFHYGRPVFRGFTDYTLKAGENVREIIVVSGNVRIEGRVDDDVMVTAGSVTIASTGVVGGSLAVFGGNAKIEPGGEVRRSVAIFGGTLDAPPDFQLRGEQVIFGTPEIADWVQSFLPWITRGFLLGRLIVPGLGWVWSVMLVSFLIGLLLNHLFYRQVGACADVIVQRPLSTFLIGLAALLLVPVLLSLVAVTVVGLVVVPFAIAACIVAAMIGKAGVARTIGRGVVSESESESRFQGARSFTIGVAIMMVAYAIPVIGILAWATAGVFGVGAAAMTMTVRLRKERPAAPPAAPVPPPPTAPPPSSPDGPSYGSPRPSESYSTAVPAATPPAAFLAADDIRPVADANTVFPEEPRAAVPPVSSPPVTPPPSAPAPPVLLGGLALYPRASFFDRMAALALDLVLVAIAYNFINRFWWLRDDEPFILVLLAYHIAFWAWKGTTLGGIICNLRVVRTNGENPRFIDALVRGLSGIFSVVALGLGCFWMITDAHRQMWHDKIAGTVVVKLPREMVLA